MPGLRDEQRRHGHARRRRLAGRCKRRLVHAVVGLSRAKRRLRSRLLAWYVRLVDQASSSTTYCHQSLLDVPRARRIPPKAAPSPAPTITQAPSISLAPTIDVCASSGEFEYEGRTLYCVEAAGEIHSVLPVNFGHTTCRYTDENSCPAGFDIWVPRNYEHLRAVYDLVRLVAARGVARP